MIFQGASSSSSSFCVVVFLWDVVVVVVFSIFSRYVVCWSRDSWSSADCDAFIDRKFEFLFRCFLDVGGPRQARGVSPHYGVGRWLMPCDVIASDFSDWSMMLYQVSKTWYSIMLLSYEITPSLSLLPKPPPLLTLHFRGSSSP